MAFSKVKDVGHFATGWEKHSSLINFHDSASFLCHVCGTASRVNKGKKIEEAGNPQAELE